jgi:hypothetical protein
MAEPLTGWRAYLRDAVRLQIRRRLPGMSTAEVEADTERRFQALMKMQVPSDATLQAMQRRGELSARATYRS